MIEKVRIIYENSDIVVINKPAGLLVHPVRSLARANGTSPKDLGEATSNGVNPDSKEDREKTLVDFILEKYPEVKCVGDNLRPGIVHRIDKEVSGILLVAKNLKTLDILQKQFKKGKVVKKYLALVEGKIYQNRGVIRTLVGKDKEVPIRQLAVKEQFSDKILNPKQALTRYQVLEHFKDREGRELTLVEVSPETGRTHQIRIHFQYIKHPLVGDKKYGSKIPLERRIFLHASYLKIKLSDGLVHEFNSPLSVELQGVLDKLEIRN